MTRKAIPWRPDEDAVLRAHYAQRGGKACQSLLPDRTLNAVVCRANSLGLHLDPSTWFQVRSATQRARYVTPDDSVDTVNRKALARPKDASLYRAWVEPAPRFASVWHMAAGVTA